MTQSSQDPNWLAIWLTVLVPASLIAIGAFVKRIFTSVTRAELREAIQDSNEIIDRRHDEHLKRLDRQDDELRVIRGMLGKIEGQISGRYPQVKGP
jgi:hypothetical protein